MELAQTISLITGVAISPLLGTGAVGAWRYFQVKTPQERANLPWFAQPWFWFAGKRQAAPGDKGTSCMRFRRTGFLALGLIPLSLSLPFGAAAQQAAPERPFTAAAPASPPAPPALADSTPIVRGVEPVNSYGPQRVSFSNGVTGVFDLTYATLPGFRPLTLDLYSPRAGAGRCRLWFLCMAAAGRAAIRAMPAPLRIFPPRSPGWRPRLYRGQRQLPAVGRSAFSRGLQDVKAAIRWLRGDAAAAATPPGLRFGAQQRAGNWRRWRDDLRR